MKKKLSIEVNVDVPNDIPVENMCKLFYDYLTLTRFTLEVIRVDAYPINTKLIVQNIVIPKETIQ